MTKAIHTPHAFPSSLDDLMTTDAGQAYVLKQLDIESTAIKPEHAFESSKASDPCRYEVYEDGSLWIINGAEDEVWIDYRDYVGSELLPALRKQRCGLLCWTQDDLEMADFHSNPWLIDDMDKRLLILYFDGDEEAAVDSIREGVT